MFEKNDEEDIVCEDVGLLQKLMNFLFLLFLLSSSYSMIQWQSYDDGINEIHFTHKPGIVLIHYSTCPACKHLHSIFEKSERIQALSSHFVMISCKDGNEPKDKAFDGGSI